MTQSSTRKLEFLLLGFGLFAGLLLSLGLYVFLNRSKAGRDFESLDDLRQTMLQSSGPRQGRSVDLRDILNPHPSDLLIYDLRPNLDVIFQGVPLRTNSCGMRNPEVTPRKAANTYRIAVIGDSFAFGWGVEEGRAFPRVLERLLNERASNGITYEVLNFGVPGYSTFQEVALFKEKALDFEPDAVLVYFVENDFGLPFYVRSLDKPGGLMPGTALARLSWSDTEPRAKAEVQRQNRFNAERSLIELASVTRPLGIPVFVAVNPRPRWAEDFNRLKGARKSDSITMINMWHDFIRIIRERKIPDSELTLPTDPHPTAVKHGIYAEVLAPYFLATTH